MSDKFEMRRRGYADDDFPSSWAERAGAGPAVRGTVKWYNSTKGFGFISFDDGPDAFIGSRLVEDFVEGGELPPGATVEGVVGHGDKGPMVVKILTVDLSTSSDAPEGQTTKELGTVKFFDPIRGFGFIAPDFGDRDVFLHASALKRSGIVSVEAGDRFSVEVVTKPRGIEVFRLTRLDDDLPQKRERSPEWARQMASA
jgi:cold shock protein